MKAWDWSKTEERYTCIAECIVRDCHYTHTPPPPGIRKEHESP